MRFTRAVTWLLSAVLAVVGLIAATATVAQASQPEAAVTAQVVVGVSAALAMAVHTEAVQHFLAQRVEPVAASLRESVGGVGRGTMDELRVFSGTVEVTVGGERWRARVGTRARTAAEASRILRETVDIDAFSPLSGNPSRRLLNHEMAAALPTMQVALRL